MSSLRSQLLPLLQQLPSQPTAADCERIIDRVVEVCRTRPQPRKALAVTLRHLRTDMSPHLDRLLSGLVSERLAGAGRPASTEGQSPAGRWLTLHEAAAVLELHPNTLAERLRAQRYRRLYGWPIWDGHQWRFAAVAIDSATAAACLATLPTDEPLAIELMLPDWCERAQRSATADLSCGTTPAEESGNG